MKRVVTFGVVVHRNQLPVNFNLDLTESQNLVVLSNTKINMFGNYFLKCNKVIFLISFNRFSEYK